MSCKECMHYEVCIRRQNSISLNPMKCGYKCPEFKNKADFVDLEALREKTGDCPLSFDCKCVPMARGCAGVDMFTCHRLLSAYYIGCKAAGG